MHNIHESLRDSWILHMDQPFCIPNAHDASGKSEYQFLIETQIKIEKNVSMPQIGPKAHFLNSADFVDSF